MIGIGLRARRGRDAAQQTTRRRASFRMDGRRARRECVGWVLPQPRPDRGRRCLELGRWRLWQAGPRRRAGPAAAEEGRGLFTGRRVAAVSTGGFHSLAITADGPLWSWGSSGSLGLLGHGNKQDQLLPKKVEAFAGRRVVAVSAGVYHSLAITADGAVWSWGDAVAGQLGHGGMESRLLPSKIEALEGRRVVAVSAGGGHSLALTVDGAVYSWGTGPLGRIGRAAAFTRHSVLASVHGAHRRPSLPPRTAHSPPPPSI